MITEKVAYVTEDFKEFDTREEAEEHEKEFNRRQELYNNSFDYQLSRLWEI